MGLAAISFKVEVGSLELCWVRCRRNKDAGETVADPLAQAAAQQLASGLLERLGRRPSDQKERGSRTGAYDIHGGKWKAERCCYTAPARGDVGEGRRFPGAELWAGRLVGEGKWLHTDTHADSEVLSAGLLAGGQWSGCT